MRNDSTSHAWLPPLAALILLTAGVAADEPSPGVAPAAISVSGQDARPQRFDAVALAGLPQHTVHAQAHGKAVSCSGPQLIDVLAAVGTPSGDKLRGKNLGLYVRISAADGYRAVFALAELDPEMRDAVPILTDRCDGTALDDKDGPFRIVVPDEKRPARWVRQVTSIDVLSAP